MKTQDRLVILANKRVPKAIKAIQLVGELAKHKPSAEQADAIVVALNNAFCRAGDRLRFVEPAKEDPFQL